MISASLWPDPIKAGIPPVVFGAPIGGKAPPGDAIGAEAVGAGAMGVGAATDAEAKKLSTSLEVIIPSMPLPAFMENKSIFFSAASFFAAGLAKGRSPLA